MPADGPVSSRKGPTLLGAAARNVSHFSRLKELDITFLDPALLTTGPLDEFAHNLFPRLTRVALRLDVPLSLLNLIQTKHVESLKFLDADWEKAPGTTTTDLGPVAAWLSGSNSFPRLQELNLRQVLPREEWFDCLGILSNDAVSRFPALQILFAPHLSRRFGDTYDKRSNDLALFCKFCRALPALKQVRLAEVGFLRYFQAPAGVEGWRKWSEELPAQFGVPLSGLSTSKGKYLWEEIPIAFQRENLSLSQRVFAACYRGLDFESLEALSLLVSSQSHTTDEKTQTLSASLFHAILVNAETATKQYADCSQLLMIERRMSIVLKLLSRLLTFAWAKPRDSALLYIRQSQGVSSDEPCFLTDFRRDETVERIRALFSMFLGDTCISSVLQEILKAGNQAVETLSNFLHLACQFSFQSLLPAVLSSPHAMQILRRASSPDLYQFASAPQFAGFAQAHRGDSSSNSNALFSSLRRMWLALISSEDSRCDTLLPLLAHFAELDERSIVERALPATHAVAFVFASEERALLCARTFGDAALILESPHLDELLQHWSKLYTVPPAPFLRSLAKFALELKAEVPVQVAKVLGICGE